MAEEPQPPTTHEGAVGDVDDETPTLPKSAEDRKAAAAMSSVSARGQDDDAEGAAPRKNVDQEALGKAMKSLSVGAGAADKKVPAQSEKARAEAARKREEEKRKAAVKVDAADVALLVEELELSKVKATDLLKTHDGNAVKAMELFVTASAS